MKDYKENTANYKRIEKAIRFVERNFQNQPSLEDIAKSSGLSKYHFQRLFKDFAGITPIQFMHYLTVQYAKKSLAEGNTVINSALDVGLSGGSRLYDMFVKIEAMTPGEYKELGKGVKIAFGISSTPFGDTLIATTDRGLCTLRFLDNKADAPLVLQELKVSWPNAVFREDIDTVQKLSKTIFNHDQDNKIFKLFVKGTNFQVKVWQALLSIPEGSLVSYQGVASLIGRPTSTRAVASAIAKNPIAYLIPCHRIISKSGDVNNYRWGTIRKKIIIGYEAAKTKKEN